LCAECYHIHKSSEGGEDSVPSPLSIPLPGKIIERVLSTVVAWLGCRRRLLRRNRTDGPELQLVAGAGARLRDLRHELLADQIS
jgi:hypothetical protein